MVHLKMEARNLGETRSHNIVADLKGTLYPEEIVLVSGHIDSWDVGQGYVSYCHIGASEVIA
jgi:carboxypeptidase Q